MTRQISVEPAFMLHRYARRRGQGVPMHAHEQAQLTFVASGVIQVHTEAGRWLVPPHLAVWAPSGVPHRMDVLSDAELWMIKWRPATVADWASAAPLGRPFVLRVTALLRALLPAAFTAQATPEKVELLMRLILGELKDAPDAPTFLPLPSSAVGCRVAALASADPRHAWDIDELASRAATSARTISRLFPAETGLTFRTWRQRARIVHAIDLLSRGRGIARVAAETGFASTAAFCFAFRQVTAVTPTAFLDDRGGAAGRTLSGQALEPGP